MNSRDDLQWRGEPLRSARPRGETVRLSPEGIHPDDLPRVQQAIADCTDPAGDGRYNIEYRVIGQNGGAVRHIVNSGQTTFSDGRAAHFIGAATDVIDARRTEAATCRSVAGSTTRDDTASADIARIALSQREHDVLVGLIEGGTNKSIGESSASAPAQ